MAAALAAEGFRLVSGGTDNHMVLLDLREFDAELTGKEAQEVLDRGGHHDQPQHRSPTTRAAPSSRRACALGTAAETTAGMGEGEMADVAALIGARARGRDDEAAHRRGARRGRAALCAAFNPYATFAK